jgi:A/G-specific adenine glycosylase
MWEFPNARLAQPTALGGVNDRELAKSLKAQTKIQVKKKEAIGNVSHAYTHFKVTEHVFICDAISIPKDKNLKWVKVSELENYPMGKIDRQIDLKLKKRQSPLR